MGEGQSDDGLPQRGSLFLFIDPAAMEERRDDAHYLVWERSARFDALILSARDVPTHVDVIRTKMTHTFPADAFQTRPSLNGDSQATWSEHLRDFGGFSYVYGLLRSPRSSCSR